MLLGLLWELSLKKIKVAILGDDWFVIYIRRRQWHPIPVLLPGESHGQRSLEGCSPWGRWGSDTTERLHFHFSLWCIGEGDGNPLQCSCLENPRDGGAWWAAVYGVAQSWTQLRWLSSSSSSSRVIYLTLFKVISPNKSWMPFWYQKSHKCFYCMALYNIFQKDNLISRLLLVLLLDLLVYICTV